jgi:hypothetical protein
MDQFMETAPAGSKILSVISGGSIAQITCFGSSQNFEGKDYSFSVAATCPLPREKVRLNVEIEWS